MFCEQGETCTNAYIDWITSLSACGGDAGSDMEGFDPDILKNQLAFGCVKNENGEYCTNVVDQVDESNIQCSDITAMGCCYDWLKKSAACIDGDSGLNVWESMCVDLPSASCSGTPTECASASSLALGIGAFFASFILFVLN